MENFLLVISSLGFLAFTVLLIISVFTKKSKRGYIFGIIMSVAIGYTASSSATSDDIKSDESASSLQGSFGRSEDNVSSEQTTEAELITQTDATPQETMPSTTEDITQPPTQLETVPPTTEKTKRFIVYWGNTGDKIHISPSCRTIKNGVISGTLEECKSAGHTGGWCGVCSGGWTDEKFLQNGNPYS